MRKVETLVFENFILANGVVQPQVFLSYEVFGKELGTAPVVLVNHALTGNSTVTGMDGWWSNLIDFDKTIDLNLFTVLAFNIPGNGYLDEKNLIENYRDFTTYDIAALFWKGLDALNTQNLFAVIGGSLGGAIAWEMAAQRPNSIENLIPVATHFESSDWVISNVLVQDLILNNSQNPMYDARVHAMLMYRTPESFQSRFNRKYQDEKNKQFQVESWLIHHGEKLENRFSIRSYKLMNHLLKTIDINGNIRSGISEIKSSIHTIAIDSDQLFPAKDSRELCEKLRKKHLNVFYHEIKSIHGHDAFLIEYEQLNKIVKTIFK